VYGLLLFLAQGVCLELSAAQTLSVVDRVAQKNMQAFNELSKRLSIADISQSIVSNDAQQIKAALQDLMSLNKVVSSGVSDSVNLWNEYLESVENPTKNDYFLGQVMNSMITAIRALTLRSSVDQSMILSLVKKLGAQDRSYSELGQSVDVRGSRVENNWKSLRID